MSGKIPITPHIPGGLTTAKQLRHIADVADRYGASLKIVGNVITLMGLSLADGEKAKAELGGKMESFIVPAVRAVSFCPGKQNCPRALQDSSSMGMALDEAFFGQEMPGKVRIAVSGCPNCCAEPLVRDIGLYGTGAGYTVAIGGSSGLNAKVATVVAQKVPSEEIVEMIRSILDYYRTQGERNERLGQTLERVGWDECKQQAIPEKYRGG